MDVLSDGAAGYLEWPTLGERLRRSLGNIMTRKWQGSTTPEQARAKQRVGQLIGGIAILKAVGFEKDDDEGKFVLSADAHAANLDVIRATLTKLEEGFNAYVTAGPGGSAF